MAIDPTPQKAQLPAFKKALRRILRHGKYWISKDEAQFAEESFTPQTLSEARELCAMSEELIDCALIVIQQARILVDQTRKLRAAQRHTRRSNNPSPPTGKSKVPFPMMRA